jgi:predicted HicB family RNase H-like nuclease
MKSFTLHKVDEKLYQLLLQKAEEKNLSMNKLVKGILRSTLGIGENNIPK